MTQLERLARLEHGLRPWLLKLSPKLATKVFSQGRTWFAHKLDVEEPEFRELRSNPVRAWNLTFRLPIWNAAGMFKDGGGFDAMFAQGAGAYVAGTTTASPRPGNVKLGIQWPAVPYPNSHSASNWMGLPNPGHTAVATRISRMPREHDFPVGASLSADPDAPEQEAMKGLLTGLSAYSLAKADYIELNESCPNVPGAHTGTLDDGLLRRLEIVSEKFLRSRHRPLPVVVKFSNDLDPTQLPYLIKTLVAMEFDGIILGNTSTRYAEHRRLIKYDDKHLYDMFTKTFGGGLSGAVLRNSSLELTTQAVQIVRSISPAHEFHIIRCGGISGAADIRVSMEHGVVLHQWYTGYYEAFATYGHDVYQRLSSSITDLLMESNLTDTLS